MLPSRARARARLADRAEDVSRAREQLRLGVEQIVVASSGSESRR